MTVLALQIYTDWMEADGVLVDWPYDFKALRSTDIRLSIRDEDGNVEELDNQFSFLPAEDFEGGFIRYPIVDTPLAIGNQVRVHRTLVLEQSTDIGAEGSFNPELHEQLFDKLTMMLQQVYELAARSLHMPFATPGFEVPLPAANSYIGWNSAGTGIENKVIVTSDEVLPAAALTYLRRNAENTGWEALSAEQVKDHLGLEPGEDVQAYHINLQILSDMTFGTAGLALLLEPRYALEEDITRTSEETQPVIPKSLRELVGIAEDALALGQAAATGTAAVGYISPPVDLLSTIIFDPADMEVGDTFDGELLANGDVLMVAVPGGHVNNGLWTVQPAGSAVRTVLYDTLLELGQRITTVSDGSHQGEHWMVANALDSGDVVGTDPMFVIYIKGPEGYEGEVIAARQGELDLVTRIEATSGRITGTLAMRGASQWVRDVAGNRVAISTSVNYIQEDGVISMADFGMVIRGSKTEQGAWLYDKAGNRYKLGGGASVAATASSGFTSLFTDQQIVVSEGAGEAERKRIQSQDLDWMPTFDNGMNCIGVEGQSFAGIDGITGVTNLDALLTKLGLVDQGYMVGPDERCLRGTPTTTYITFNTDTRVLFPLREQAIPPSPNDFIYTAGQVADGNFPMNARTGGFTPIAAFIFQYLNMKYWEQTGIDSGKKLVGMNKAKNEGELTEILQGSGLDRAKDLSRVFLEAVAHAPNGVSSLNRQFLAWLMNHGQHDENPAATSPDYTGDFQIARDAIWTDLQAKMLAAGFPQTKRPMWLISQVASFYGLDGLRAAQQQLDMGISTAVGNRDVALISCDSELPSYGNLPDYTGTNPASTVFPESGNKHPNWIGKVLQGIRYGIALHYYYVRRTPLFLPFNHKFYRSGSTCLFSVANMGTGLRAAYLPHGNDIHQPKHLGYSVRTSGGVEVPIIGIEPIPGTLYSVQAQLAADPGDGAYLVAGGLTAGHYAQVFLRDNMKIEIPRNLSDWAQRQLRFSNRYYGNEDYLDSGAAEPGSDTGFGWLDNFETNALGRPLAQTAGLFDCELDLGNPCARGRVTSELFA